MRIIALADALYWIAGSIVVIGGFFVFLASAIKHVWTSAVERKAATMKNTYLYQTNIDIYNVFFDGAPARGVRTALPTGEGVSTRALAGPVDLVRIEILLRQLLHEKAESRMPTVSEMQQQWSREEVAAALDLCGRADQAGLSPVMQEKCNGAAVLLEQALESG